MKKQEKYYWEYQKIKLKYDVLYKWMLLDLYNRRTSVFLNEVLEAKTIAIYGASDLGVILYRKLYKSIVNVECFIESNDKRDFYDNEDIRIIRPNEINKIENKVDLIVISAINSIDEINNLLKELGCTIPTISLEEVIMEMR